MGQETGEPKGNMRQVRSEQFSILRHVSEGSEQGAEGEEEEEEELERLKTPSPATGQRNMILYSSIHLPNTTQHKAVYVYYSMYMYMEYSRKEER